MTSEPPPDEPVTPPSPEGPSPADGPPPADAPTQGWGAPPEPAAPVPADAPTQGWGAPPEPAGPPPASPPPAEPPAQPTPGGWGAPPPAAAPPPAGGWGTPPPAGPPGYAAPGGAPGAPAGWNPAPPSDSSGSSGCLKGCLILVVIGVVLLVVAVAGLVFLGNRIVEQVGVNPDGSVGTPCPFISDADLSDELGSPAQAILLDGLYDATLGLILDKRVLPDAEDCWITADETTPNGRLARYQGSDAAAVFAAERQAAQPTSEDQGGGISVTTDGYDGGDLSGIGDEAFCTGVSPAIMSGVLVRQGDTLVYVSLSGPADAPPDMEATENGVIVMPSVCQQAAAIADRILP